jgi:hypothetical protein
MAWLVSCRMDDEQVRGRCDAFEHGLEREFVRGVPHGVHSDQDAPKRRLSGKSPELRERFLDVRERQDAERHESIRRLRARRDDLVVREGWSSLIWRRARWERRSPGSRQPPPPERRGSSARTSAAACR